MVTAPGPLPGGGLAPFASVAEAGAAVLRYLAAATGFEVVMLTRVEAAADAQVVVAAVVDGYPADVPPLSWSGSLCVRMLGGAPRAVRRLVDVPVYASAPNVQGTRVGSYAAAPVRDEDGGVWGTLCCFGTGERQDEPAVFLPLLDLLAGLLGTAVRDERTRARLREEARRDALTGIANRRAFDRALRQRLAAPPEPRRAVEVPRPPAATALLLADVDGLKRVNDRDGHLAGDALLRRVASTLLGAAGPGDLVARVGGDEFAVLAGTDGPATTAALAARLQGACAAAGCPVSVGWADTAEVPGEELLGRADDRLYVGKRGLPVRRQG